MTLARLTQISSLLIGLVCSWELTELEKDLEKRRNWSGWSSSGFRKTDPDTGSFEKEKENGFWETPSAAGTFAIIGMALGGLIVIFCASYCIYNKCVRPRRLGRSGAYPSGTSHPSIVGFWRGAGSTPIACTNPPVTDVPTNVAGPGYPGAWTSAPPPYPATPNMPLH